MRTIRVSERVWQAIAARGRFGETEDDVLRRVFDLPVEETPDELGFSAAGESRSLRSASLHVPRLPRRTLAARRMSSYISDGRLIIEFQGGQSSSWQLPDRSDKAGIRTLIDKVIEFTRANGASMGQTNTARKTLTDQGYHLTK